MRIDKVKFVSELVRRDMTQKRLSELSNVSRATIGGIKSGRACSCETAGKLANALGVSVEYLLEVNDK